MRRHLTRSLDSALTAVALDVPYSWPIRSRFAIYGWIAIEFWWQPGMLGALHWIGAAVLGLKMLSGFFSYERRSDELFSSP